jgi:hypothetical protein
MFIRFLVYLTALHQLQMRGDYVRICKETDKSISRYYTSIRLEWLRETMSVLHQHRQQEALS